MKKTLLLIITLLFLFFSCDKRTDPDTTPPVVTITNPQTGSTVSEIAVINCVATDNKEVKKVELWVDGVNTNITDETEPYSLIWNTTIYSDSSSHTITIRAYDESDNKTDSDAITLMVDNSNSYPQPVNIALLYLENGGFNIIWNKSPDSDFDSYKLEKSLESTMLNYEEIHSSNEINDTTFVDYNIDPLIYQYYRITVADTLGYETNGSILSTSLDPLPVQVNIISVVYTLDEMIVTWQQSPDDDFLNYKLLYAETEFDEKDTIAVYTEIITTSHLINEFDPTHENWFWILVSDYWDQTTLSNGYMVLDSPPSPSELYPVIYVDNTFIISWSENQESDFLSYTLFESLFPDMSNSEIIYQTFSIDDTLNIIDITPNQNRFYQVVVEDIWDLQSVSNIQQGSSHFHFLLTFNNPLFTDIEITVYGYGTQIAEPGGSTVFDFPSNPGTITYHAETSGQTTTGSQIGLLLEWDYTHNFTGQSSYTLNLITTSDYFFIYVQNTSAHVLTPFYVNYGTSYQTTDNILLPNDGLTYRTGYYRAFTDTEVRAYWQDMPSWYYYWVQGINFFLPFNNNQSIVLTASTYRNNIAEDHRIHVVSDKKTGNLMPGVVPNQDFSRDGMCDYGEAKE